MGLAMAWVWLGENLLNIARYLGDARAQVLPLVGGGEHDWTGDSRPLGTVVSRYALGRRLAPAGDGADRHCLHPALPQLARGKELSEKSFGSLLCAFIPAPHHLSSECGLVQKRRLLGLVCVVKGPVRIAEPLP